MKFGIPQGSCLAPRLLLVYTSDLQRAIQNSRMSMFADDTCLFLQSSNISLLMRSSMDLLFGDWNAFLLEMVKGHSKPTCAYDGVRGGVNICHFGAYIRIE